MRYTAEQYKQWRREALDSKDMKRYVALVARQIKEINNNECPNIRSNRVYR